MRSLLLTTTASAALHATPCRATAALQRKGDGIQAAIVSDPCRHRDQATPWFQCRQRVHARPRPSRCDGCRRLGASITRRTLRLRSPLGPRPGHGQPLIVGLGPLRGPEPLAAPDQLLVLRQGLGPCHPDGDVTARASTAATGRPRRPLHHRRLAETTASRARPCREQGSIAPG